VAAAGSWATAQEETIGIPNLCVEAVDSATIEVLNRGLSRHVDEPSLVTSNEAGNCVVTFDRRMGYAPIEVAFKWNGEDLGTIPIDPEYKIDALGFIYTFELVFKADGSYEILTYEPARQIWWCGPRIGECHATTADAYFSPECIASSHDEAYLKLYKPGTGPSCLAHTYEKVCTIDPVTNEEHCPVVIVE